MNVTRRQLLSGKATTGNVLVCVFQRGAADGLNSLVPYGDDGYYASRPRVALPPPGQAGGVLDLDGFFGLHPALAPVRPLYDAGRLALVHACGVPHESRSHFDAQALVEAGVIDKGAISDGWLGRYLAQSASADDRTFRAVAISGAVPNVLAGANDPLAVDDLASFGLGTLGGTAYPDTLSVLYAADRPYAPVAQAALVALEELAAADPSQFAPENGAAYPSDDLGGKLLQAAQLIKAEIGVEVICADVGGWDHHENENTFLPRSLDGLARALAAFDTDLGARMAQVTVLVMTEFGRRVADNGSAGTDHGTAGLFYALGGSVAGGLHGVWPGLSAAQLHRGEDLAITTDLRGLLAQCLERRQGFASAATLFPGFTPGAEPAVFL